MNNRLRLLAIALLFTILAMHGRHNLRAALRVSPQYGEPIAALLNTRGAR